MARWLVVSPAATMLVAAMGGTSGASLHSARGVELNPMHALAVERAVAGAARRLQSPACRGIFADFRDEAGAPLQHRLDALGVDAPDYLSLIVFADGSRRRTCQAGGVLAVTAPGSRVVYVCGLAFHQAQALSAARAEVAVLHEALHTLGLGENPPDSLQITRRVRDACAP